MLIGLTGGVGSGKSTVAGLLAEHGAVVIDADAIVHEVQRPGQPAFEQIVEWLGPHILLADGTLDRPAIAARVFSSDADRERLNTIVHPAVAARSAELMAAAPPGAVIVYDVPLLVETGAQHGFEKVIVVQASLATRLERLARRGMSEADARARMAKQATDAERAAVADFLVDNDGTLDDLRTRVDQVWAALTP